MEWQGIDLTDYSESKWIFTAYNTLKNIVLGLFLIIGMSGLLTFYHLQKNQEIHPLVNQLNELKNEISTLENKLTNLKNNNRMPLVFAKSEEITKQLNLIHQLPLKNGGINSVQIYLEKAFYLKLSGKLSSQEDFQKLEKYLNNQNQFEIKTDLINLNNKNEIEFIFTLKQRG